MEKWLQGFAYRVDPDPWVFAFGGVSVLGVALLTVAHQTIRSARANPVEAMRYE